MEELMIATGTLEYIEKHIREEIKTDDIASYLYCSRSSVEKIFRYVINMSIKDYCVRRRMTLAARDMRTEPDVSILELAFRYGYGSNEAFTRSFKSVWHTTPSEYCKNPLGFELFPAIKLEPELMKDREMISQRKVDISEFYDILSQRVNCYIVAVDIKGLVPINEISHEAGDIAILTALSRLKSVSGEEDIVFRIGGDEFVSITNSPDVKYAEQLASKVLSLNGNTFDYAGKTVPLSLYATIFRYEQKVLRYSEVFHAMQEHIDNNKEH